MNYKSINTAILSSRDIPKSVNKDNRVYNYLLSNNVAFYYSTHLSKGRTAMDKMIIEAGKILNDKFLKTLQLINRVSKKTGIKYLLFKTYKYIPEIVDGDIDIFIQRRDFHNFSIALEREGFNCIENEPLKSICTRDGYCTIEPRVNASFHGIIIFNEEKIWQETERLKIDGIETLKVIKEIDLAYLLLSILYGPNYLKLYLLLAYKNRDIKKLYTLSSDRIINEDLRFLFKSLVAENVENKRFPLFMGNIDFTIWWYKRILFASEVTLYNRFKHIIFFFYSKYSYLFFNKLVFKHDWAL